MARPLDGPTHPNARTDARIGLRPAGSDTTIFDTTIFADDRAHAGSVVRSSPRRCQSAKSGEFRFNWRGNGTL